MFPGSQDEQMVKSNANANVNLKDTKPETTPLLLEMPRRPGEPQLNASSGTSIYLNGIIFIKFD